MEFLALIHEDKNGRESLSDEEGQAIMQRYMTFSERDEVVSGAELDSTAPRPQSASVTATGSSPTAPTPR